MTNYGNSSIDLLEGAERVRTRPASVLGSNGIEGARHGVTEIIGNSLDESTAGFGDRLDVEYYEDGSISVRDYGRGVPMGYNEAKKVMNWYLVFNEMYAGGKYKDYQEELKAIKDWSKFNPRDYNYLFSIGLNGLGAASTQYTSEYFKAVSYRDGIATEMNFKHGYPLVILNGEEVWLTPDVLKEMKDSDTEFDVKLVEPITYPTEEPNGTYVKWKPDIKVFSDVDLKSEWVVGACEAPAYVGGVSVNFKDHKRGIENFFEKGDLSDLILKDNKSNAFLEDEQVYRSNKLTHGTVADGKIYVCQADMAVLFTESKGKEKCFHNSIKMGGGAQYDGIRDAVSEFFSTISSEKGVQITYRDYEGKLSVLVSSYSNLADYKGQTKDQVEDYFIYKTIKDLLLEVIQVEYHKQNETVLKWVEEVVAEANHRIEMQRQSKAIKELNKVSRQRKLPEKFESSVKFDNKDSEDSELWIVEGDSAKTSVSNARNSYFQAIYAIRGKMTNALKASIDKILGSKKENGKKSEGSKEIKEIFALAGTGMEIEGLEEESFNLEDSRFDKYVIATDADEDGYQIRVLVFCAIWKLAPKIIKNGMLYIALSPKYGVELRGGETHYLVTDEDLEMFKKEHGSSIVNITRYKGLGQVNPSILSETTMNPETRKMIQVQLDPADHDLNVIIDTVFGPDPMKKRKETLMALLGSDVVGMFNENSDLINLIDKDIVEEEDELEYV